MSEGKTCKGPIYFADQGIEVCESCGGCTCCKFTDVDHKLAQYHCLFDDGTCYLKDDGTCYLKGEDGFNSHECCVLDSNGYCTSHPIQTKEVTS